MSSEAYTFHGPWDGPVVATAIHAGHDLRTELVPFMALAESDRFREEDPFTDWLIDQVPSRLVVHRSRFEVDLNRATEQAVYRRPEDCWNLQVWHDPPLPEEQVTTSLRLHEQLYADLAARLDRLAAAGPYVVLDVHSYNHRRDGAEEPPEAAERNPEVNVGTGSMDRDRWSGVVEAFIDAMASHRTPGGAIDVRENVRFKGANLARWVHERYPEQGCAMAIEFKKTYMDEWTGVPDKARICELAEALASTIDPMRRALEG